MALSYSEGAPIPVSRANGSVASLPPETIEFAGRMFNLAREGEDDLLRAYLDAGLPANLTNDKGTSSS